MTGLSKKSNGFSCYSTDVFVLVIAGGRILYKKKTRFLASLFSGAKESRTPDLLHAMQALYQLSYILHAMQALYQLSYNPEDAHKYRMS